MFVSAALAAAIAFACRPAARPVPDSPADPRRCALALGPDETPETHAVRCAEWFILRPDPPSPSGRAVTMDTAFAEIHFERGSFDLTMALADTASCRVVPGQGRR
jgi:hypothetical protein